MERCDHGKIEWCPKCDEDLRKSAERDLVEAEKQIKNLIKENQRLRALVK